MRFLRRFALLAAMAAGSAVLAGPALGARPGPVQLPFTLDSTHFRVHYQSDLVLNSGYAITQTTAGDIATLAERAYTAELADGFPAPVSDGALGGDGRIDIYVDDLTPFGNPLGLTIPDNPGGATSSTYIELDGTQPELAFDQHTIAHELFHTIQLSTWNPSLRSDLWLFEGSAEWMGFRVANYDVTGGLQLGPTDMALDCGDPIGTWMCDFDTYANNGYSRWGFFEYMWERYGPSFMTHVLTRGAAGASSIKAVNDELVADGTSLAATYNAWSLANLIGGYSTAALQGTAPDVVGSMSAGTKAGNLGTFKIPLNHLSTRVFEIDRGSGDASQACYAATLTITVALPANTQSQPYFWWAAKGNPPVALSVNGNTATTTLNDWDTCTYAATKGFLMLTNASSSLTTNVDAADFAVTLSMTVDPTKQATPFNPPDPVFMPTPTVAVTSVDVAPTLTLFGPEVLSVAAGETKLRLIVESTGQGSVQATLGAVTLGTASIRAGNNDLRFTLPASVVRAVRRSATAANVLTLTPTAPNGTTIGQPVTRTVQLQPTATKAKSKTKPAKTKAKKRHK
jgi:hypothetical protein